MQVDEQSQLPVGGTQQSVAMSSQRTAQYHWGSTPHALTQQQQQTPTQLSKAPVACGLQAAGQTALVGQASNGAGVQHTAASSAAQQQLHKHAAYAGPQHQQLPPTASGVSQV